MPTGRAVIIAALILALVILAVAVGCAEELSSFHSGG